MKTAVSIPDDIFEKAEKLATETGQTRSALYAQALREMLKRIEDDAITAQINAAIAETGQPDTTFIRRAAHELGKRAAAEDKW